VAERLDPSFLRRALGQLPQGVAIVSGTNGKTTTTRIVVELLRAAGLKVFTNPSGSNFTRGVSSAAIAEMRRGRLEFDLAVLELDEAHAVHFVDQVRPTYALLLNVLRDQLDRFGEIDTTARYLGTVAHRTTKAVVLNREDPLVAGIEVDSPVYFGYSARLAPLFPSDDELYGLQVDKAVYPALITLDDLRDDLATYNIGSARLLLPGAHNALNAAAALALTSQILGPRFDAAAALRTLSTITPAFGRGERFVVGGTPVDLILVKNPSGFRVVLSTQNSATAATMIAINDAYADGRDMSWLWDVDFSHLGRVAEVSGVRAFDMALRLTCQDIEVGDVDPDVPAALSRFLAGEPGRSKQIYATYTAMLRIRPLLKHLAARGTT
jgi:UDP-N-acetylmuramyl tripeptide synthase